MKKRTFNPFIWLLMIVLVLTAANCSGSTDDAPAEEAAPAVEEQTEAVAEPSEAVEEMEPVTITYFTFSAAPDHMEELNSMIALFEESHSGITVEVETAPFDEYFTKLQALIAGGEAPDVFELNYENFVSYAARDVLLDLGPLAAADSNFDANVFYPRATEAFSYNGQQLAYPATFSTVVLFYNKDLFDAAGIGYPEPDWTWSDAVTAAQALTDAEAGVWGLFSPTQFWEFYKKAEQNNCQFFSEDMSEVLIDSPACVETLQTMINFVGDGVMPSDVQMGGVSDGDMFANGQLGMAVTGIWMFSAFADAPFAWDIQVEPGMEQQATHFFANGVAAFDETSHPEAAWEWIKFFTASPEMAQIRIDSGWELPALNNPDYVQGYLEQSQPENRTAVFESLEYAIVPPVIERQNEMQDVVNQLLDQVKLGQLTPEEALSQAKVQIEALLEN